uniref:Putative tail protein n=1 Tax=viral metagenome TaxID=1070528 RepID=A0A6M3INJ9_9ZZZZ
MNWSKGVKTEDNNAIADGKKKGSFVDATKGFGSKYVELINGVDYMIFLEYGWSKAAPAGVVRVAIQKMKGNLPALMNDEYIANWNSAGL